MSEAKLIIAVPSKGRLLERSMALFDDAGLSLHKIGHERGYRGVIAGIEDVDVLFLSPAEIASYIGLGRAHLGITGEDLIREQVREADQRVERVRPLGFGQADVVVAVPKCWIDVHRMRDIDEVTAQFYRNHGRQLRVATKYPVLTRRFFADAGIAGYRIVESMGATEGAPAAGMAEIIVDITSTGATLRANHLKILDDGLILRSQANLFASRVAEWPSAVSDARARIEKSLLCAPA
jgi:ATP phosphoribosyltransferase